jgi:hypothetical protein
MSAPLGYIYFFVATQIIALLAELLVEAKNNFFHQDATRELQFVIEAFLNVSTAANHSSLRYV